MTSVERTECIKNTTRFVQQQLENAEGGHDWFHIER
ncbi:MAG TPA: phosphohydrolase, partial [Flavobacteriaceae bacterium]|nr:phosphohydrolase [Flavobacteriaceae bacterium]